MNLYQDHIRDHYHNPRCKGVIESPEAIGHLKNPACGDVVIFSLKIKNNQITQVAFEGAGCVISQATASMLAESIVQHTVDEVCQMSETSIQNLLKLELGPVRMRCAKLPLEAVQKGLKQYAQSNQAHTDI